MRQTRTSTFFRPLVLMSCGLIGAVSVGLSGDAASLAFFKPTRHPFMPELTVNEHPTLCPAFLGAAKRVFLSNSYLIELSGKPWPDAANSRIKWLKWNRLPGRSETTSVDYIELEFGAGQPAVIISRFNPRGMPYDSSPPSYSFMLVDSRERFDAIAEEYGNPKPFRPGWTIIDSLPEIYGAHIVLLAKRSYQWAVLEHDGRYFMFSTDPRIAENLVESPNPLDHFAVHEILPDMTVRKICAARVFPMSGPTEARSFREAKRNAWSRHWPEIELPDALAGPPELLPLYHTLATMLGNATPCGVSSASHQNRYMAEMDKLRIAFRPWTSANVPVPAAVRATRSTAKRIRGVLASWGNDSLWNHRVHRRLDGELATARTALTAYYRDGFGVPAVQAEVAAAMAIDRILIAHFPWPNNSGDAGLAGYGKKLPPLTERIANVFSTGYSSRPSISRLLDEAALVGLPGEQLVRLMETEALGEGIYVDVEKDYPADHDRLVSKALQHPELVKFLLEAGADVNHRNRFGKTALMYAAQFDLPDAMTLLLDHGADIGLAATVASSGCRQNSDIANVYITRSNRTALTYAAEYASLGTIRKLLDAGARTDVEDTLGNSLLVYLAQNNRLSAAEKAEARGLLSNAR